MLAFFDLPAEHWNHLRMTNPIVSVFATVRHRTVRTEGVLSPTAATLMAFRPVMAADETCPRLDGGTLLPEVAGGATVEGGIEVADTP